MQLGTFVTIIDHRSMTDHVISRSMLWSLPWLQMCAYTGYVSSFRMESLNFITAGDYNTGLQPSKHECLLP